MNLPFFRTDYHFWVDQPQQKLVVVRGYTQSATASEARAIGRSAALAVAKVADVSVHYFLGTTVPVPGVTTAKAPQLRKPAYQHIESALLEKK